MLARAWRARGDRGAARGDRQARSIDRSVSRGRRPACKERTGQKGKALFHPIRVALTGENGGPELDLACRRSSAARCCRAPASRGSSVPGARARSRAMHDARSALARVSKAGHPVGRDRRRAEPARTGMIIYGINPVLEALRAGRVRRVRVGGARRQAHRRGVRAGARAGVQVERVDAQALERDARGGVHQGIVAESSRCATTASRSWSRPRRPRAPLIVVLDGIEDPHNVGAILRTVDAAGAHGVDPPGAPCGGARRRRGKASAGALAHVRIATVVNIARALEELKEAGVWTVGLAGDAPERYDEVDLTLPTAIVVGAEGDGLRRLVAGALRPAGRHPDGGAVGA